VNSAPQVQPYNWDQALCQHCFKGFDWTLQQPQFCSDECAKEAAPQIAQEEGKQVVSDGMVDVHKQLTFDT
jgi:hypothetical protein